MTRPVRRDVGIVGAGFGGAASAVLLARAGHRVTVYERAAKPDAVGAGILLQPSGLAVLRQLGLLEGALERGARVDALSCKTQAGRSLFELRYRNLGPSSFGIGMHRGALFELLLSALRAERVTLCAGVEVGRIQERRSSATLLTADSKTLGEHELVIVADGARSALRRRSPALTRARAYPFGALWFIGKDAEQRFAGVLSQTCSGTQRMLGFLPSGLGPRGAEVPLVSLFWSVRSDDVEQVRKRGIDAFKADVMALEPRAEALLQQIEHVDQLLSATYMDAVMSRFYDRRVAYVGDAAHATSPQLGQGTNLALVDAATLAVCLSSEPDLGAALGSYSTARADTSRFYQWASRWLTPVFQSDLTWLGPVRDAVFPTLCRIPPLHREMLLTLAGHKRGFFAAEAPADLFS
ncbi:MAG: NAD(P)/FAD-dependent oxidoreductase [Polyangiaceae bacterium]